MVASAKAPASRGPADLAGRKVSVNSLGAAGDVTIMESVAKDGGDPTPIKFVEVAFPDVPAQLAAGNIDAAWVPEPFVSQLKGRGDTFVVAPYQNTVPGLATLTTFTTTEAHGRGQPTAGRRLRRGDEGDPGVGEGPGQQRRRVRQALKDNMTTLPPAVADVGAAARRTAGTSTGRACRSSIELAQSSTRCSTEAPNLDRLIQQQ